MVSAEAMRWMTVEVRLFMSTTAKRSELSKVRLTYWLATGSRSFIKRLQVVAIESGVIASDGINLPDQALTIASLDVDQQVQRLGNIAADRSVRKLNAGLKNAGRKSRQSLPGRVGMECGQRSGVPGVKGLEQVEGRAISDLPQKNPVRPQSQGGLQEVADHDRRD